MHERSEEGAAKREQKEKKGSKARKKKKKEAAAEAAEAAPGAAAGQQQGAAAGAAGPAAMAPPPPVSSWLPELLEASHRMPMPPQRQPAGLPLMDAIETFTARVLRAGNVEETLGTRPCSRRSLPGPTA